MSPKILLPAAVLAGVACFFVGWKVGRLQVERRLQSPIRVDDKMRVVFGDPSGTWSLIGTDVEFVPMSVEEWLK